MSLKEYNKKRNFNRTKEPSGEKGSVDDDKLIFVVQRHKATQLHYDFRIELNGVLKSWAVPKGPSMNPQDKRLAMMVEDHPYDYKDFKGVIEEGYGAGIVEIWDKGTYSDLEGNDKKTAESIITKGIEEGHFKIILKGKKLKGSFAVFKMKGNKYGKDNSWFMLKHKDKYAVDKPYNSEDYTSYNSPINKALRSKTDAKTKEPEKINVIR